MKQFRSNDGNGSWPGVQPACRLAVFGLMLLFPFMNAADEASGSTGVKYEHATFGGGCFWCVEAVFERVEGVKSVVSGYAGGKTPNPTYREVCTGETGHAEVVDIQFDPAKVGFDKLLELFWDAHDPTTPNRQGADRGTQYRSVVFYHNEEQKKLAQESVKAAASKFRAPIVTEIAPLPTFYAAEDYHQDYFQKNPNAPYCAVVIQPKLKKLDKLG